MTGTCTVPDLPHLHTAGGGAGRWVRWALPGVPTAWLAIFVLLPLGVLCSYSFGENAGPLAIEVSGTFGNYARVTDSIYLGILGKSLVFSLVATLLCLLLGGPVALMIAFASPRVRMGLLIAVTLSFWTNLLIRTFSLMTLMRTNGYINLALGTLGVEPIAMMHSRFAVVVGLVYVNLPILILPIYAALDGLDRTLIEASFDLGARRLRTLFSVIVPLALPGILSGVFLCFIGAFGSYVTPDLLGGPDSQMIANVIERQFKRANDWPFGAALSFTLIYLTLIGLGAHRFVAARRAERAEP